MSDKKKAKDIPEEKNKRRRNKRRKGKRRDVKMKWRDIERREMRRLCILSLSTQNALCDFIFYPSHRVQPNTLYPVRFEAFGTACDASCVLRLCAGLPAIANAPSLRGYDLSIYKTVG